MVRHLARCPRLLLRGRIEHGLKQADVGLGADERAEALREERAVRKLGKGEIHFASGGVEVEGLDAEHLALDRAGLRRRAPWTKPARALVDALNLLADAESHGHASNCD